MLDSRPPPKPSPALTFLHQRQTVMPWAPLPGPGSIMAPPDAAPHRRVQAGPLGTPQSRPQGPHRPGHCLGRRRACRHLLGRSKLQQPR